jgi:acyl-CoA synthetase (AMP-forming)/AMP-acid ligase II
LAADLRDNTGAGERAVLLYPQGIDFAVALLACFWAGVVAVPAAVPSAAVGGGTNRLRSIVASASPTLVLCHRSIFERRAELVEHISELTSARWQATDAASIRAGDCESRAQVGAVALIQYTSGSTASPKGVMVTHGNIVHNERSLQRHYGQDENSISVSWLPAYHDMGLIGSILNPLFVGGHACLMSMTAFLKSPYRWLEAISLLGATTAAAPDGGYGMCVREVDDAEKAKLDLRRWRCAIVGGEVVRPSTIRSFADAFAKCGFRADALRPSYGLAESTLVVSAGLAGREPLIGSFDRELLTTGRVEECPPSAGRHCVEVTSSGRPSPGTTVAIVEPDSGRPSLPGTVGEIWVKGESVALGYHGVRLDRQSTFGGFLDGDGPYCRTGDLGFIHGGELYVSGRLKDLIIVNGLNHHPEDIEQSVEADDRLGRSAAFSVDDGGGEKVVVVAEVPLRKVGAPPCELEQSIRQVVYQKHGLNLHAVALVRRGSIPKTTSGKVCRRECKRRFVDGTLTMVMRRAK